jgi:hypothetical protein
VAAAQVPPDIEAALQKIGPIVDPACTALLYRPLMPKNDIASGVSPLYPGIDIARNQPFGTDPDDVVDIYSATKGPRVRPVLIFVPGGGGNKTEIQNRAANAFYDNVGRWGVKHGLVVVIMQRHRSVSWDGGARDISNMLQWVEEHVAQHHGDASRMVIWAHSAGNRPLGTYIGRPELYGPRGVGVRGVIFMSGAFDIAPLQVANGTAPPATTQAGATCNQPDALTSPRGALPGSAPGTPGGPTQAPGGRPGGGGPTPDPAQLEHSTLPALKSTQVKIMLINASMDPGVDPTANQGLSNFNKTLSDALCAEGQSHCPTLLVAQGESHMSQMFSFDTSDHTVSGPVLAFIRSVLGGEEHQGAHGAN